MSLWIVWWNLVYNLQPAFTRRRTFLWFAVALAATCARTDLRGITSLVRTLGLRPSCYDRLLDFFRSPSTDPSHPALGRACAQSTELTFING